MKITASVLLPALLVISQGFAESKPGSSKLEKVPEKISEMIQGIKKADDGLANLKEIKEKLSHTDLAIRMEGLRLSESDKSEEVRALLQAHLLKAQGEEKGLTLALLLKKGVKGLAGQMADLKDKLSPEMKMRVAYNCRYVTDAALARELQTWFKNDKDELVQEYALLALNSQKEGVDLKSLKEAQSSGKYPKNVDDVLKATILKHESLQKESDETNSGQTPDQIEPSLINVTTPNQ